MDSIGIFCLNPAAGRVARMIPRQDEGINMAGIASGVPLIAGGRAGLPAGIGV
jgi:hypothetical protein